MMLGNGVFMKYILREPDDYMVRFLGAGKIERDGSHGLLVYREDGTLRDDLSGARIRSWHVVGPNSKSIDNDVEPRDAARLGLSTNI
jgi:hypothetical protein